MAKIQFNPVSVTKNEKFDATVVGSGMGSLTAACLMAHSGLKVCVLEQNYLPGGCTSSYWRKGFVFEAGATTLVGLDEHMPLRFLLDKTGIDMPVVELKLPMKVYLSDGTVINKYKNLDQWIAEAGRVFGQAEEQKYFWRYCYEVSQFVWQTSLKQTHFPPSAPSDFVGMAKGFRPAQLLYAMQAFRSTKSLLKKYNLHENKPFRAFIDEQLLITAIIMFPAGLLIWLHR